MEQGNETGLAGMAIAGFTLAFTLIEIMTAKGLFTPHERRRIIDNSLSALEPEQPSGEFLRLAHEAARKHLESLF
jgi:hypothetical protein